MILTPPWWDWALFIKLPTYRPPPGLRPILTSSSPLRLRWAAGAKVIFVQIQASSQVIPLPGVPTLFLDVKTPEDITDSKVPRPPQVFRGFQLFQITIKGGDPSSAQVVIPHLHGKTECSWISWQEQVLPPELEDVP